MFDDIIAVLIPLVAVAIMFTWGPLLNLICPPCRHSLERRLESDAVRVRDALGLIRD